MNLDKNNELNPTSHTLHVQQLNMVKIRELNKVTQVQVGDSEFKKLLCREPKSWVFISITLLTHMP